MVQVLFKISKQESLSSLCYLRRIFYIILYCFAFHSLPIHLSQGSGTWKTICDNYFSVTNILELLNSKVSSLSDLGFIKEIGFHSEIRTRHCFYLLNHKSCSLLSLRSNCIIFMTYSSCLYHVCNFNSSSIIFYILLGTTSLYSAHVPLIPVQTFGYHGGSVSISCFFVIYLCI